MALLVLIYRYLEILFNSSNHKQKVNLYMFSVVLPALRHCISFILSQLIKTAASGEKHSCLSANRWQYCITLYESTKGLTTLKSVMGECSSDSKGGGGKCMYDMLRNGFLMPYKWLRSFTSVFSPPHTPKLFEFPLSPQVKLCLLF